MVRMWVIVRERERVRQGGREMVVVAAGETGQDRTGQYRTEDSYILLMPAPVIMRCILRE